MLRLLIRLEQGSPNSGPQAHFIEPATFCKNKIVPEITFYSPSCGGQVAAKGPFGLRVKLLLAHLSTTHSGEWKLHTVPLIAECQAGRL